jgi:hypothetical protein
VGELQMSPRGLTSKSSFIFLIPSMQDDKTPALVTPLAFYYDLSQG